MTIIIYTFTKGFLVCRRRKFSDFCAVLQKQIPECIAFPCKNISIQYQNYNAPVYKQCWEKQGFIKGLSSLDLLFNAGPKISKAILSLNKFHQINGLRLVS